MALSREIDIKYNLKNVMENMEELVNIPDKEKLENNGRFIYKQWIHKEKIYNILKYNKNCDSLKEDEGLCRSIMFSNGKVNVFSPPKAIAFDNFTLLFNVTECYAEEIIEGTMINLFYDSELGSWEIATKTSVGGKLRFFREQENFDVLFKEVCEVLQIDINSFNKEYMYSFVMQHPKNKFVLPINQIKLFLIAIYKIDDLEVVEVPREKYGELGLDHVFSRLWFPIRFLVDSFENLKNNFGSMNTDINYIGVMLKSYNGIRSKIVNPAYKQIKELRGNNNKLQYQYLCLRHDNRVKEYLYYFPENRKNFSQFRKQIHEYTNQLYSNYVDCYIKKTKPLIEYPNNFRTHMYILHQHYLTIKETNQYITKNIVIEYVNKLEPSLLMFSLNYHLREIGKKIISNQTNNMMLTE